MHLPKPNPTGCLLAGFFASGALHSVESVMSHAHDGPGYARSAPFHTPHLLDDTQPNEPPYSPEFRLTTVTASTSAEMWEPVFGETPEGRVYVARPGWVLTGQST